MKEIKKIKLGEIADAYAGGSENRARGRGRRRNDAPPPLLLSGKPLSAYAKDMAKEADAEVEGTARTERVLTMGAVDHLSIDDGALAYHEMRRDLPDDGVTHAGDVVMSLTAPFQAACIDGAHEGILVTNAFAIIRCSAGQHGPAARDLPLDPWFLAAYLSSDSVRDFLRAKTAGKRWPSLKLAQLEDIEIPLLGLEAQNELGSLARAMAVSAAERRRQEREQAERLERALSAALGKGATRPRP